MKPLCFLVLFLGAMVGPAPAQKIYIVDINRGPGMDFKDLPAAVAAVPSGSYLRVRAGKYSPFTVSGKALHIRGAGPSITIVQSTTTKPRTTIRFIPTNTNFILEDLEFKADSIVPAPVSVSVLILSNGFFCCRNVHIAISSTASTMAGSNAMEVSDATFFGELLQVNCRAAFPLFFGVASPSALQAIRSRLHFTNSSFRGGNGIDRSACHSGAPGLILAKSSVADCIHITATGGKGSDYSVYGGPPNGGPGIRLQSGSLLLADGGQFIGGWSGSSGSALAWKYGQGGNGILINANCSAATTGTTLVGGKGGFWYNFTAPVTGGAGTYKNRATSTQRPSITLYRLKTKPDSHQLILSGPPKGLLLLLSGRAPGWLPLGDFKLVGTLFLDPLAPGVQVLFTQILPAGGNMGLLLPPMPGKNVLGPLWLQTAMAHSGSQTITSNPVLFSAWP